MAAESAGTAQSNAIPDIDSLFACAFGFLSNGAWIKANERFKKIREPHPDNVLAFIGTILIETHYKSVDFRTLE